jgi:hypothetical protein
LLFTGLNISFQPPIKRTRKSSALPPRKKRLIVMSTSKNRSLMKISCSFVSSGSSSCDGPGLTLNSEKEFDDADISQK